MPHRSSAPTGSIGLDTVYYQARDVVVAKRHEHLIEHHLIQGRVAGARESFGETPGVPARALDEIGEARPAEAAERGPDLDPPCPPRHFGCVPHRVPPPAPWQVRSRRAHRRCQMARVPNEDYPT